MALAPSGANTFSPENIKLLIAFNPGLRRHLLDGLGLCFIACLPQSSHVQPSQHPPALPGSAASHAALTTSSSHGICKALPLLNSGFADSMETLTTKADLVVAAEEAVHQIGQDLMGVIQTALEAAAEDQVSPKIQLHDCITDTSRISSCLPLLDNNWCLWCGSSPYNPHILARANCLPRPSGSGSCLCTSKESTAAVLRQDNFLRRCRIVFSACKSLNVTLSQIDDYAYTMSGIQHSLILTRVFHLAGATAC